MPIIPLFKPAPLANVPSPVLDRERRPTVDKSQEMAAVGRLGQIKAPDLPGDKLAAPYEALGSIGRAVEQTGSLLGALAIKQREAETDVQVADGDNAMTSERAGFETWKAENPDPAGWRPEWEKRLAGLKERLISNEKLHPGAAEQIGLRLNRYAGQTTAEVSTGAVKETFARAKSAFSATIDHATEVQDEVQFNEQLKTAEQRGYLWPHEAENARQQFKQVGERKTKEAKAEAERQEFELGAAEAIRDPQKWIEDHKEPPAGGEIKWSRQKSIADASLRDGTAAVLSDVQNAIAEGKITVPGEIDAVENKLLTPALREQAKHYLVSRNGFQEQQDKEANGIRNAVELRQAVRGYDPAKDPERTEYFSLVQQIGSRVEQSMAGELTGELYRKYGTEPPKLKLRPEVQQNVSRSLDVLFDPKQGSIPWKKEVPVTDAKGRPVKDSYGNVQTRSVVDGAAKQRAIDAQTRVEMRMNDWFRDNPEKAQDLGAVKKRLQEVLPEGTRAGVLDLLQKKRATQASVSGPLSSDLVATVKGLEGFSPEAFGDYKQTSVGYGTRAKSAGERLTEAEADSRLREELTSHAGRIDAAAKQIGASLNKGQRNALISFDFNTGQGAELLTTSGGNLAEVKRRMALYVKAGGQELPGLVARRQKEVSMFDL